MTDPYYGPGPELMAMLDRAALVSPKFMPQEAPEENIARRDRMVQCHHFDDLTPADQAWLNQAILVVSAGGSPAVAIAGGDMIGGDWQAEDAALDAGGPIPVVVEPTEPELTADDLDELASYEDVPAADDDEGWVGL